MPGLPAVILADYRTGGSFLSLCLDSHPLIFCMRGEPLARRSGLYKYFPDFEPDQIMQYIFKTEFCTVAMGKVIYRQAGQKIWKYWKSMDAKVVHLIRKNTVRATCSYLFQSLIMQGKIKTPRPLHHFNRLAKKPRLVKLSPDKVLKKCREREKARKQAQQKLTKFGLDSYTIYYEDMCKGQEIRAIPESMNTELCQFLKVPDCPLLAPYMNRVNAQYPLSELVSNWREVKALLQETEFSKWI